MEKDKLYFENEDSTFCSPLEGFIAGAKYEGLKEITLVEAIMDKETTDVIWCTQHGECVEKSDCKKSVCSYYESKSGRGVCYNRGQLYLHGEKVTFNI